MRRTLFRLLTAISHTLASSTQAPFYTKPQQFSVLTPEIDEYVHSLLDAWNSSAGISIAAVQRQDDGTWLTETKGYGAVNAAGDKVDEDTLFGIGSNSKVLNSMPATQ